MILWARFGIRECSMRPRFSAQILNTRLSSILPLTQQLPHNIIISSISITHRIAGRSRRISLVQRSSVVVVVVVVILARLILRVSITLFLFLQHPQTQIHLNMLLAILHVFHTPSMRPMLQLPVRDQQLW